MNSYEANIASSFHFSKGRVALRAVLRAMNIGAGDEVIIPAFTCLALPLPILAVGAVPVYADISAETFNVELGGIEKLVSPRTRAVILQHTYGIPVDAEPIVEWARPRHLYVIEDCCHALASTFRGKRVGTFGDAAFYSYEWGKPLVLGSGGTAVVRDERLRKTLASIHERAVPPSKPQTLFLWLQRRVHGAVLTPSRFWRLRSVFRFLSRFRFVVRTFTPEEKAGRMAQADTRMAGFLKARLERKLDDVESDVRMRRRIVHCYKEGLMRIGGHGHQAASGQDIVYLRYPVVVKDKPAVLQRARERQVEVGDWFESPVHPLNEAQWLFVNYVKGRCPVAERISSHVITLPIYDKVTDAEIDRTLAFLAELKSEGMLQ